MIGEVCQVDEEAEIDVTLENCLQRSAREAEVVMAQLDDEQP